MCTDVTIKFIHSLLWCNINLSHDILRIYTYYTYIKGLLYPTQSNSQLSVSIPVCMHVHKLFTADVGGDQALWCFADYLKQRMRLKHLRQFTLSSAIIELITVYNRCHTHAINLVTTLYVLNISVIEHDNYGCTWSRKVFQQKW